jgi:hypothetical protein
MRVPRDVCWPLAIDRRLLVWLLSDTVWVQNMSAEGSHASHEADDGPRRCTELKPSFSFSVRELAEARAHAHEPFVMCAGLAPLIE